MTLVAWLRRYPGRATGSMWALSDLGLIYSGLFTFNSAILLAGLLGLSACLAVFARGDRASQGEADPQDQAGGWRLHPWHYPWEYAGLIGITKALCFGLSGVQTGRWDDWVIMAASIGGGLLIRLPERPLAGSGLLVWLRRRPARTAALTFAVGESAMLAGGLLAADYGRAFSGAWYLLSSLIMMLAQKRLRTESLTLG